jgi:hypothetical protein
MVCFLVRILLAVFSAVTTVPAMHEEVHNWAKQENQIGQDTQQVNPMFKP